MKDHSRSFLCLVLSLICGILFTEAQFADIPMGALFLALLSLVWTIWCALAFPREKWRAPEIMCLLLLWGAVFCRACDAGSPALPCGRVWRDSPLVCFLFVPVFAACLPLTRSRAFLEDGSGLYAAGDVIACLTRPFAALGARFSDERALLRSRGRAMKAALYILVTCAIAAVFFFPAILLLRSADDLFLSVSDDIRAFLFPGDIGIAECMLRLILAWPVGLYLYALMHRTRLKEEASALRERRRNVRASLRRLPSYGWCAVLIGFIALYALFFVLQAIELVPCVSARLAPGTLTMAQWAKQGFFEMCGIMGVDLALTGICRAACRDGVTRPLRLCLVVLMVQSLLFAVIACAKLALYLSSYGFTPLRAQGAWGIAVLSAACVACLFSLCGRERTFCPYLAFVCLVTFLTFVA